MIPLRGRSSSPTLGAAPLSRGSAYLLFAVPVFPHPAGGGQKGPASPPGLFVLLYLLPVVRLSSCGGRCAVFSGGDAQGYHYALGEPAGDVRPLVRALNAALRGRGGGKPEFCQGSVQATEEEIRSFFSSL